AMYPTPANARFATEPVPSAADGRGGDEFIRATPYTEAEAMYPVVRLGLNYVLSNTDPNISAPEAFNAPEPGRDPADGDAPVDFQTDVSPIFKSMGAGKVKRGTFS